MNNNWQFTNLENSKRMKELGFKQESLFYWYSTKLYKEKDEFINYGDLEEESQHLFPTKKICSAYSVAELGELIRLSDTTYMLPFPHVKTGLWECGAGIAEETEADARALMLIWLAEQGHIDPKSI